MRAAAADGGGGGGGGGGGDDDGGGGGGEGCWEAWLAQDEVPLQRHVQRPEVQAALEAGDGDVAHLHLTLEPAWRMPPPTLSASVPGTKQNSDLNDKPYTVFQLELRHAGLEWAVERRYSEFRALHERLQANAPLCASFKALAARRGADATLPRLPGKRYRNMGEAVVSERREALAEYLARLLRNPLALQAPEVLAFVGMVSTARNDVAARTGRQRDVMHISQLGQHARAGDLVLFKCKNAMSGLQRKVTGSQYDHCGLVVGGPEAGNRATPLSILESTGDGVTVLPLVGRIRAYASEFVKFITLRRMEVVVPAAAGGDGEAQAPVPPPHSYLPRSLSAADRLRRAHVLRLCAFVREVNHLPYRLSAKKLLKSARSKPDTSRAAHKKSSGGGGSSSGGGGEKSAEGAGTYASAAAAPTSSGAAPASARAEADAKDAKEEYTDFFCSELIAAALREMGAVSYDVADAHFWPGAFATGGSIEKYMVDGFSYGDEIVIDCRIVEVSKARESPAQRAAASSKSGAAAALESSDCDSDAEEDPAVTRHALGMGAFKIS